MDKNRNLLPMAGLIATLTLLGCLLLVSAVQGDTPRPANTWTRTREPVIVSGDQLDQFAGAALDDLFVYAYSGGSWALIPFQFDEVDASGVYTVENGLLDANDELALMAMDLGDQADLGAWIPDADSQTHPRYELQVTNPLDPSEQGWIYVYRSATLAPTPPAGYVEWDAGNNRIVAGTYIMGFAPQDHVGPTSLELNGSEVDVLDRNKIRLNVTCWIDPFPPFVLTLTEEDLPQSDPAPDIDGPVRLGGGNTDNSTWAYHSLYHLRAAVDLASLEAGEFCTSFEVNWLRLSSDWLDPTLTGMAPATYYDNNTPGGVPVDGIPDAVPETPPTGWNQTSGALGSTVQVVDVLPGGGSVWNYYLDNQASDPDDTGDQQSFGDAGFGVDAPSDQISFELLTFVLDPAQPNIGATYQSYHTHPLEVAAVAQSYDCSPAGASFSWPPGVIVSVETTFTASVSEGQAPFTFAWEFGDDGSSTTGNPVVHTFALTGTFPVTLTVSNACGTADPVVNHVTVFAPGEAHLAYLPLLLKAHP